MQPNPLRTCLYYLPVLALVCLTTLSAGGSAGAQTGQGGQGSKAEIHFSAPSYVAAERDGSVKITVARTDDTSSAVAVGYTTIRSTAPDISDYIPSVGTLRFLPGETAKTFTILIIKDRRKEAGETVRLVLSRPAGGAGLGAVSAGTLASDAERKAGQSREVWDGKDLDGAVVPNEAYFFCVEAVDSSGQKVVYDPTTFSGGESADLTQGQINHETGTLNYTLSQPSRVLIRAGIPGSALLKTVVDWQPRVAGEITEYWNGKDEDNLIDVLGVPNYMLILTYMTLPDTSVITVGNDKVDYRAYKAGLKTARPLKEERAPTNARRVSPHFTKSRVTDRAFKVRLTFPELGAANPADVPQVKDKLLVRVGAGEDKDITLNQQFEIILFVDNVFYAEEEREHLPFNFPVELTSLSPGDHVITANVITFGDQIGIGSRRITVVK